MAIARRKAVDLKLESEFASGDHIKNGIKSNFNYTTRTSVESKLAGEGDGPNRHELDLNLESCSDISEEESAYEELYSTETSESESDDESESTNGSSCRSSLNEIQKFQLTSSSSYVKQDFTNLNKKFASTSKICDSTSLKLEDKLKCMSLNEVRPVSCALIKPTRKNMSFTNDQVMKIERDNEILLRKIMAKQKPSKSRLQPIQPRLSSSAINRKRFQKKVEEDNLLLLRRLQKAKSCVNNTCKLSGCRTTHL